MFLILALLLQQCDCITIVEQFLFISDNDRTFDVFEMPIKLFSYLSWRKNLHN